MSKAIVYVCDKGKTQLMGDLPRAGKPGKLTIYVRNGDHCCQPIFGENIPLIGSSGHKSP